MAGSELLSTDRRRGVGGALGLSARGPEPVVVGKKAYVQWWERIRAAVVLVVLVVLLGLATAAAVGALFLAGSLLLEQVVG